MTTTDTQRGADGAGLIAALEALHTDAQRRSDAWQQGFRQSNHRLVHPTDEALILAVVIAAERRRQAQIALDEVRDHTPMTDYPSAAMEAAVSWFFTCVAAEDNALASLAALTTPARDETAVGN